MKTCFERGTRPGRGYLAPCLKCGRIVVHATKTMEPFHMHRYSKRCREAARQIRGA
jgi:hypothetical protein